MSSLHLSVKLAQSKQKSHSSEDGKREHNGLDIVSNPKCSMYDVVDQLMLM